jgi:hypothetical protein
MVQERVHHAHQIADTVIQTVLASVMLALLDMSSKLTKHAKVVTLPIVKLASTVRVQLVYLDTT